MITSGAISYETALLLTVPQLEFLYSSRCRLIASERSDFTIDLSTAVSAMFSESGGKALTKHINALQSIASNQPLSPIENVPECEYL